jgi:aspartate/methionine/tyrosine aminotransferase
MPTDISLRTRFFRVCHPGDDVPGPEVRCRQISPRFTDFSAPAQLKQAAKRAIDDYNQYAVTYGSGNFRAAIAEKTHAYNKLECDPDLNITVICGATEAMIATLLAVINPATR